MFNSSWKSSNVNVPVETGTPKVGFQTILPICCISVLISWKQATEMNTINKSGSIRLTILENRKNLNVFNIFVYGGSDLYNIGISVLSLDWRMPIDRFGDHAVQGNLDPAVLFSDPQTVERKTKEILERRGHKPGFIFNLGHGIYPETPMENVESMVNTVKNFSV